MKTQEQKLIEEISLVAKAIVMAEELKKANLKTERDYKEDILCWTNRINVLVEQLKKQEVK